MYGSTSPTSSSGSPSTSSQAPPTTNSTNMDDKYPNIPDITAFDKQEGRVDDLDEEEEVLQHTKTQETKPTIEQQRPYLKAAPPPASVLSRDPFTGPDEHVPFFELDTHRSLSPLEFDLRKEAARVQAYRAFVNPGTSGSGTAPSTPPAFDLPLAGMMSNAPSRPISGMAVEELKTPRHLREPLLNLGELVVEGVTQPRGQHQQQHHIPRTTSQQAAGSSYGGDADEDRGGVFESFFDLTTPRLKIIFDALDAASTAQRAGVADFKHLRRGLADAGVRVDNEAVFARLVDTVDRDLDGGLTFSEFEAVVQSLKMAYLLRGLTPTLAEESVGSRQSPKVRVLDYSVAKVSNRAPTASDLSSFLYIPRPIWAKTRWIDVTSPSDFVVKGLAIKYRLHPLALEDALHVEFDQSSKLDRYESHIFLVFPGMILDDDMSHYGDHHYTPHHDPYHEPGYDSATVSPELFSNQRQGSRFWRRRTESTRYVAGGGGTGTGVHEPLLPRSTSISRTVRERALHNPFLNNNEDDASKILANFPGVLHFNVCMFLTWPAADTLITVVDKSAGGALFRRVRSELQVSYSRLRSQNALFLMYTVLDVLVDGYSPVMDAFEAQLGLLRMEVRQNAARRGILFDVQLDTDFLARYHDVLHELTRAKRRLSPAIRVISHLTAVQEMDPECRVYLRDVLDHAEDVVERLNSMVEDCKTLKAEQQHAIDSNMTKSMAALTIVGIIFLPAQFLTGVFGMNFKYMPGLESEWGFTYFWAAAACSWILMWMLFRRYRVV